MSQSGETADVRESLRMVKEKGCLTFGIVNVVGSTIARMTDMGLYTHAGVEVGVASTKNIIAQLAVLVTMALSLGLKRNLQVKDAREIVKHLAELPAKFESELQGAIKLNSLIHAECYSAGELKHGPLALVNPLMPTIVLNLKGIMRDKTASNIKEVKARN
jgi:glucosamine--fructose-6-phosphate aminotransferase (isomerizing)